MLNVFGSVYVTASNITPAASKRARNWDGAASILEWRSLPFWCDLTADSAVRRSALRCLLQLARRGCADESTEETFVGEAALQRENPRLAAVQRHFILAHADWVNFSRFWGDSSVIRVHYCCNGYAAGQSAHAKFKHARFSLGPTMKRANRFGFLP
ncbi:hypothetical protein P3T76_000059 [Phytophthora citrophthora]|uniref:Uncharacterized protein n=1 Tax=Phytophthora citrophthora TaxID=4793 RepID=A0AAD9LV32_9STRA|nr:hypothetical protein P3T76_000059 [Phytophthora citrophthora]